MGILVDWVKRHDNVWQELTEVDIQSGRLRWQEGVYLIWHGRENPSAVCVGHGRIVQRLATHRLDVNVLKYQRHGLYVTWAYVAPERRDSVVQYLEKTLMPKLRNGNEARRQVKVNIPWTQ